MLRVGGPAVTGGGIEALPLSVRAGLFAALAVLALGALLLGAREQWRDGDLSTPVDADRWWRTARLLLPLEAGVGLVALVSAAILGGVATTPGPAPVAAAPSGPPLLTSAAGGHVVPIAIAPGLPGPNRVVVGVQDVDADGVAQPAAGVTGVTLGLACQGCDTAPLSLRLEPAGGGPWYAATVTLGAASWTLTPVVESPRPVAARPVTTGIEPARPGELLVGVAADLSGPDGGACQNRALGVELALAGAGGEVPPRLVLDDITPAGAGAAVERLAARGAGILAAPCGGAGTLGAVAAAATRLQLPLVGALRAEGPSAYLWRTGIDQEAEGAALAARVRTRGAGGALVLVGPRPEQAVEAAAVERDLGAAGLAHHSLALAAADPAGLATELRERNPDALVIVASPRRALPVVVAVSRSGWLPSRGVVASSDLLSVAFVEAAAPLLRGTVVSIAGELDPADPASRAYLDALRRRLPLRTPGIEGTRGYYSGLLVDRAASVAAADPSPAGLEHALQTAFTGYGLGLFRLGWGAGGGGPERLAFFRPGGGGRLLRDGPPVAVR